MVAKIRTTAEFQTPNFDLNKYRNKIDEYITKEQIIAIRRWLINILKHTPTYTGTARGTYAPVGRIVRRYVRKGHILGNPEGARRKKYFKYRGVTYPLGFTAGANYSEHKIKKRKYRNRLFYTFEFDQRLPYVVWNETLVAPEWITLPSEPPWFALRSGKNAYIRYFNGPVVRGFPKIIDSVGKFTIRSK